MKYFVKFKEGGPYTLSEIAQKFGDDVELIPAKVEPEAKPIQPRQLELPQIPFDGGSVLGGIALMFALIGCAVIAFGIIATIGQPPERQLSLMVFGGAGFLANCLAIVVGLCALITRPTVVAFVALSLALISGAVLLFTPL